MRHTRFLLGAVALGAAGLFVFELPIRELVHQRAAIATTAAELATLNSQNQQLSATITQLRSQSVVSAIAHANYGLVFAGQQSYVVLPGKQAVAGAANSLGTTQIPTSDLVLGSVSSLAPSVGASNTHSTSTSHSGSLANRTFSRLEFWRWAF